MTSEQLFYEKKKSNIIKTRNAHPPLLQNAHASLSLSTTHSPSLSFLPPFCMIFGPIFCQILPITSSALQCIHYICYKGHEINLTPFSPHSCGRHLWTSTQFPSFPHGLLLLPFLFHSLPSSVITLIKVSVFSIIWYHKYCFLREAFYHPSRQKESFHNLAFTFHLF